MTEEEKRLKGNDYRRRWYAQNKEHHKAKVQEWVSVNAERKRETDTNWRSRNLARLRDYDLQRHYGISLAEYEYDALLAQQNGVCAICDQSPSGRGADVRLNVDHDHRSGIVRGLLCGRCNKGLGLFRDQPHLLARALSYLQRNRENHPCA